MPVLKAANTHRDVTIIVIGLVTAIYSVVLFLIASLGYHDPQLKATNSLLVIAVQLQYVMSYFALRTNYLERLRNAASRLSSRGKQEDARLGLYLAVFAISLPFFIPIVIVVLVLAIRA